MNDTSMPSRKKFKHKSEPWPYYWSSGVRQHLGERLHYFLVKVRPFEPNHCRQVMEELIRTHRLGGVRTFQILGPYDLIIRAWLHTSLSDRFEEWVKTGLGDRYRYSSPLYVTSVEYRWYRPDFRPANLSGLDKAAVRSAENDDKSGDCKDFLKRNLLYRYKDRRDHSRPHITFFVAVSFREGISEDAVQSALQWITEHVAAKRNDLHDVTVDRGVGFCDILIKGSSPDFFHIGALPTWITENLQPFGATTESFVSHGRTQLCGDERVGEATFLALRGKDLFIQEILPEFYRAHLADSVASEIEGFLDQVKHKAGAAGLKLILHDYLLGVLNQDGSAMAEVLFKFFHSLEGYLRDQHKTVIPKLKLNVQDMYIAAGMPKGKRPDLTDLLQVFHHAFKAADAATLSANWKALIDVRNAIIHNTSDPLQTWQSDLHAIVEFWQPLQALLLQVEKRAQPFRGKYWVGEQSVPEVPPRTRR